MRCARWIKLEKTLIIYFFSGFNQPHWTSKPWEYLCHTEGICSVAWKFHFPHGWPRQPLFVNWLMFCEMNWNEIACESKVCRKHTTRPATALNPAQDVGHVLCSTRPRMVTLIASVSHRWVRKKGKHFLCLVNLSNWFQTQFIRPGYTQLVLNIVSRRWQNMLNLHGWCDNNYGTVWNLKWNIHHEKKTTCWCWYW